MTVKEEVNDCISVLPSIPRPSSRMTFEILSETTGTQSGIIISAPHQRVEPEGSI